MSKDISFEITPVDKTPDGINYHIEVHGPMDGWYEKMFFIVENEQGRKSFKLKHTGNDDGIVSFSSDVFLPTRANYRYYFSYFKEGKHFYIKEHGKKDEDISRQEMYKMSVNFSVPDWAKGKMMYHIFVDRFNRGSATPMEDLPRRHIHTSWDDKMQIGPDSEGIWNNDFYGGDIKGILEKLDYIESLGVSILYLSPIVSSQSNHRYDTADYETVDPYAGTNEDLKLLCEEAHKRG